MPFATVNGAASVAARVGIFADMIVFYMSYAMRCIMSFIMIVMVMIIMPRALKAAKRMLRCLRSSLCCRGS